MKGILTTGELIKRYIDLRGRTCKEVASDLNIPYKTFCGILNRDVVKANMLFQLANLLDIDLCWMSQLFNKHRPISPLDPLQVPRMQNELREHDHQNVVDRLVVLARESINNITYVRRELIKEYHLFYLLDILLPEEFTIRITVERSREKYFCTSTAQSVKYLKSRGRSAIPATYEGQEMLDILIAERMK